MLLRLEGCAERFAAAVGTARTNGDLICSAIGVAIVIVAILHVALDSLNVLARMAAVIV
jgi:hypothetical protein